MQEGETKTLALEKKLGLPVVCVTYKVSQGVSLTVHKSRRPKCEKWKNGGFSIRILLLL